MGQVGARTFVGAGFLVLVGGLAITSAVLVPAVPLAVGIAGWASPASPWALPTLRFR